MLGAPILVYRAVYLILAGHAAHYVAWLQVLTCIEQLLALSISISISVAALVWLGRGARAWCALTLRLTAAIILLHAFRVAVYVIGRTGAWIDVDLRPEHRPLDPAGWDGFQVWLAGGLTLASLVVLAGALIRQRRLWDIHK